MKLKNKVALVLGGIKGIGKNICLELLKSGAKVITTWFDWEENLPKLKQDFSKFKNNYLIEKINLLEINKIPLLIKKIINKYGKLNILINNIERGGWPIIHGKYTQKQWDLELATTLRSKQWIFENTFPYLNASKKASIINFSSVAGITGRTGTTNLIFNEGYSIANMGISILTKTWAKIGAPNIRVNEIVLGIFETRHGPKTKGWNLIKKNTKKKIINQILLKRLGKTDDIIKTVKFLLEKADYMTGTQIKLDGGYSIGNEKTSFLYK